MATGRVAQLHKAELHVMYAMDRVHRPLRAVMSGLHNVNGTVQGAADVVREIQRVVSDDVVTHVPIIDIDDPAGAVHRRAQQLDPELIVTPAMWEWNPTDRCRPSSRKRLHRSLC